MRICISRTERNAYSETFIRDQIAEFSKLATVYAVYGGRFPERQENNQLLHSKLFWFQHKMIKGLVGRNNFFSNYSMKKYLRDNKIDVVLANYGSSASHFVPVCKSLDIPLLPIFHGHDATNKKYLTKYKAKYQKLFEYASFIIVVSEEMKFGLVRNGAPENKIKVIPCGVNISKFKPKNQMVKEPRFLAVGRFTNKKGPLYTLRAFYRVLQQHPTATLTMVGKKEGVLYDECEKLVEELKMEKAVLFTGILNQDQIADLMQQSLAFVQHSITASNGDMEGTPVSVLEAAASALPVISTMHGGIKEAVIHGKTGFLVEEKDEDAMAKYMIQLIENPRQAQELGAQGRAHIITHYQQQDQIAKIYELAQLSIQAKA